MSKEPKRNVYVGHRYVPKLMGEWDKSQTYEGLSIVTNKGTSYTSKKRVPKGIDILNEEYWVVTGNYNAQIEEYRGDVLRIKKDMTDLETDLTKDMTDLETVLTKDMTDLETSLTTDMSKFKDEVNNEVELKTNTIRNETKESINKLKESFNNVVINVKDLGAKGDGKTDDFNIFQLALNMAEENKGGYVFVPAGTYKIGGRLEIGSNVHLIGVGKRTILDAVVTDNLISGVTGLIINKGHENELPYQGAKNFSIRNLCITSSDEKRQGIYLDGAKDYYIADISSIGTCLDHWFDINNTKNGVFERLTLNKPKSSIFQLDVRTTNNEKGIGNDSLIIRDVFMEDKTDQSAYEEANFRQSGFHFHRGSCRNIFISNVVAENIHTLFHKDPGIDITNLIVKDVIINEIVHTFFFEHGSNVEDNKYYKDITIEDFNVKTKKCRRGIGWFGAVKNLKINRFSLQTNDLISEKNGALSIGAKGKNVSLKEISLNGDIYEDYKNIPLWEHDYLEPYLKELLFKSLKGKYEYNFTPTIDGVTSGYEEQVGKIVFDNGNVNLNVRIKHNKINSSAEYFAIKNLPLMFVDENVERFMGVLGYLNNSVLNDGNNILLPYINNLDNGIRIRKNYRGFVSNSEIKDTPIELNLTIDVQGKQWENN